MWYSSDKDKKHKLGLFYKATLKQQSVLCRVIEFDRMTTYVLDNYFEELTKLKKI